MRYSRNFVWILSLHLLSIPSQEVGLLLFTVLQMRKPRRVTSGVGLWCRPKQCASRGSNVLHCACMASDLQCACMAPYWGYQTLQTSNHRTTSLAHPVRFHALLLVQWSPLWCSFRLSSFFFSFFPLLFLTLNNLNLANFKVHDSSACSNLMVELVEWNSHSS